MGEMYTVNPEYSELFVILNIQRPMYHVHCNLYLQRVKIESFHLACILIVIRNIHKQLVKRLTQLTN